MSHTTLNFEPTEDDHVTTKAYQDVAFHNNKLTNLDKKTAKRKLFLDGEN